MRLGRQLTLQDHRRTRLVGIGVLTHKEGTKVVEVGKTRAASSSRDAFWEKIAKISDNGEIRLVLTSRCRLLRIFHRILWEVV